MIGVDDWTYDFGYKAKGNLSLIVDWRLFDTTTKELLLEISSSGAAESKKKINYFRSWMINTAMSEATEAFLDKLNEQPLRP